MVRTWKKKGKFSRQKNTHTHCVEHTSNQKSDYTESQMLFLKFNTPCFFLLVWIIDFHFIFLELSVDVGSNNGGPILIYQEPSWLIHRYETCPKFNIFLHWFNFSPPILCKWAPPYPLTYNNQCSFWIQITNPTSFTVSHYTPYDSTYC